MPARGESEYNLVVPTLVDSDGTGMHYSVFFVSAVTADPFTYYDSVPDSGYSVDNIAPQAPTGFVANYVAGSGNELAWDDPVDADFQYFKIYRSTDPDFVPGPANLLHSTIETSWTDAGVGPVYYKLSAVDCNGNESDYASASMLVGVDNKRNVVFGLGAVSPNPARSAALNVEFSLPSPASARLELMDVAGRRLVSRNVGALGAGKHEINLAEGRSLPPGLYFIRLTQDHCRVRCGRSWSNRTLRPRRGDPGPATGSSTSSRDPCIWSLHGARPWAAHRL